MEHLQFRITDKNGKSKNCYAIATYHHDENNKDYIVYTDNTFDKNGRKNLYHSLYKKDGNNITLIDNLTKEDKQIGLQLIEGILKCLKDD